MPEASDRTVSPKVRLAAESVLVALLLLAALAAVYPGVFLRGEQAGPADVYYNVPPWNAHKPAEWKGNPHHLMLDIYAFFAQTYYNVAQSYRRGEWPLWNPHQMAGMPLLANYQCSVFYPPRLLLLFFDLPTAMTLMVLLKLWLCGFVGWLSALGLGLPRRAALFFALTWMLSGYCLIWAGWPLPDVAAWFPLLFLGVEWILAGRYRRGIAAGAAGAVMMLLAGHPETAFTFSLGLGVYFGVRCVLNLSRRGPVLGPVLACAVLWTAAILICAAQLVPFAEYLLNSATFFERQTDPKDQIYTFRCLASFFMPRFLGTVYEGNYWGPLNSNLDAMLHPGAAVLLLVSWLAFRRRGGEAPSPWSHRLIAMTAAALFVTLLAFDAPTLGFVHRLPVFSSTHRAYHIAFALFALPLAAAFGLAAWTEKKRRLRELLPMLPLAAAGAALVFGLYQFNLRVLSMEGMDGYIRRHALVTALFFLAALAVLAVQCLRHKPRLTAALLAAVTACNLLYLQWGMNPTSKTGDFFPRTELTDYLRRLGHPCRIGVSEGTIPSGTLNVYGIEDALAYDGIYPARLWRLQHKLGQRIWQRMEPATSVDYYLNDPTFPILVPEAFPRLEKTAFLNGIEVYKNRHALPRARLVGNAEVPPGGDRLFERMTEEDFDPARTVLLERPPREGVPAPLDAPGTARIAVYDPNRVVVRTEAAGPAVLVLADAWYPGWRATVNGAAADLFPAYHAYRGVVVPKGSATVEFTYAPASLRLGLAVSLGALSVCAAWLTAAILRRRAKKKTVLPG